MTGLLAEWYERCELEAQNPLPMTAVNIFSQLWISGNIHLQTLGWPIQINGTFWNILKSHIIRADNGDKCVEVLLKLVIMQCSLPPLLLGSHACQLEYVLPSVQYHVTPCIQNKSLLIFTSKCVTLYVPFQSETFKWPCIRQYIGLYLMCCFCFFCDSEIKS